MSQTIGLRLHAVGIIWNERALMGLRQLEQCFRHPVQRRGKFQQLFPLH